MNDYHVTPTIGDMIKKPKSRKVEREKERQDISFVIVVPPECNATTHGLESKRG